MRSAVIIGSAGQDGYYLVKQLRELGYSIVCVDVTGVTAIGVSREVPSSVDLLNQDSVRALIEQLDNLERLFYVAAYHHSSDEPQGVEIPELLRLSLLVNVEAWANVLDVLAHYAPKCRSFYAASSHIFGAPSQAIQSETTPVRPTNIYGITKAAGLEVTRFFRARGQHTSAGILYNHESERRQHKFVSQRIAHGAVAAARACESAMPYRLELGNLSAVVDWGYAPDYTRAMMTIVDHEVPSDYVVATGVGHTVGDFCAGAFNVLGLDWRSFVIERPNLISRPTAPLIGDASKLHALGWTPSVTFERMVELMVTAAAQSERQQTAC